VKDAGFEERRREVLAMLDKTPSIQRAVVTHPEVHAHAVIVTIALRGRAAGEVYIPKAQYDAFRLLQILQSIDRVGDLAQRSDN